MQSHTKQAGFTLTEIIITMAMFAAVGSLSIIVGLDTYRNFIFRSQRDTLVMALLAARSQAVNNICFGSSCTDGKPHGVAILTGQYVIFQGASYASRDAAFDQAFQANTLVNHLGASEVDFAQLSGQAITVPSSPSSITLRDAAHSDNININKAGMIDW
jgi:prepilin-type N-terminal cleavage/methylation domain-containing protein